MSFKRIQNYFLHLFFNFTHDIGLRSAYFDNPTVKPIMKWIGSPVTEIWPFDTRYIMRGEFVTHIFEEGEVLGVIDGTIQKSDGDFL